MAKNIKKYQIFLASPSDVSDERECVKEVVDELNISYGSKNDIFFELLRWETHSAPGFSEGHVQDLIDDDLGVEYDLFIGILWKKFGTATTHHGSGTEQEFVRAHKKFKEDPTSVQALFYFKEATPLTLSEIDPNELIKINSFKEVLREKNILYSGFNSVKEFQQLLRIHITKRIEGLNESARKPEIISIVPIASNSMIEKEELGVYDFLEDVNNYFEISTNALSRIGESTTWIGKEMDKKTEEISGLTKLGMQPTTHYVKDFLRRTSQVMLDYVSRVEPEVPIFMNNFESAIDSFSKVIDYHREKMVGDEREELDEAFQLLQSLITSLEDSTEGLVSFRDSVQSFPKLSKELINARRSVEKILNEIIQKFTSCKQICIEVQNSI